MKPIRYNPSDVVWQSVRMESLDAEFYIRRAVSKAIANKILQSINSVRNEVN